MDTREWLKKQIENLDESSLIEVWNKYCERNRYDEQRLHPMEEFNDMFAERTPLDIATIATNSGDFDTEHDWFTVRESSCGTEVSSSDEPLYLIDMDELLDDVEENTDDYNFLDDSEYREEIKEGFENWEDFERWFDEEYGCDMYEFDIEELIDEWKAEIAELGTERTAEMPWGYGEHFD